MACTLLKFCRQTCKKDSKSGYPTLKHGVKAVYAPRETRRVMRTCARQHPQEEHRRALCCLIAILRLQLCFQAFRVVQSSGSPWCEDEAGRCVSLFGSRTLMFVVSHRKNEDIRQVHASCWLHTQPSTKPEEFHDKLAIVSPSHIPQRLAHQTTS